MADTEKRKQFLRFCINGVVATAIQYGTYIILLPYLNAYASNTVAYILSFLYNFISTSYWTFRSKPSIRRLAGFCGSHLINYLSQQFFLFIALSLFIQGRYAALIAMACAVPINFALLRIVYRK